MELQKIADEIKFKVDELKKSRETLEKRGNEKATKAAEYDRDLAITIIRLKNGESLDIEAYKIEKPPVTLTEKIAKGI